VPAILSPAGFGWRWWSPTAHRSGFALAIRFAVASTRARDCDPQPIQVLAIKLLTARCYGTTLTATLQFLVPWSVLPAQRHRELSQFAGANWETPSARRMGRRCKLDCVRRRSPEGQLCGTVRAMITTRGGLCRFGVQLLVLSCSTAECSYPDSATDCHATNIGRALVKTSCAARSQPSDSSRLHGSQRPAHSRLCKSQLFAWRQPCCAERNRGRSTEASCQPLARDRLRLC
jgi:hypothetical protein